MLCYRIFLAFLLVQLINLSNSGITQDGSNPLKSYATYSAIAQETPPPDDGRPPDAYASPEPSPVALDTTVTCQCGTETILQPPPCPDGCTQL